MQAKISRSSTNSPIVALGIHEDWLFYIDVLGQHRALQASQLTRNTIFALFGASAEYLQAAWPTPDGSDWDDRKAAEALISAAIAKGVVLPENVGFVSQALAAAAGGVHGDA
ncbi:MAG: hypothetical protein KIT25_12325 [Enhydrobacter sp.]|nr:MAG: hypothetical protein KIT25_12325 [Enhydrobacter sp.]